MTANLPPPQYIAVYVIKYQHTTCFLLLLCLQFQKLSRFQKRFDAHFCYKDYVFGLEEKRR